MKEEKVDPSGSQEEKTEPDVQLIGDDGTYAVRRIARASFCDDKSVTLLLQLTDVWMEVLLCADMDVFFCVINLKALKPSIIFCLYEGAVDSIPFGATGSIVGHQDSQSSSCQPQSVSRTQSRRMKHSGSSSGSRGVEVSDSSPHLKCEMSGSQQETTNPQQLAEDGSARSNFDTLFVRDGPDQMLAQQPDEQARAVPEGRGSSCSYSTVAADFLSSSVNGWTRCTRGLALALPLPQQRAASHKLHHPPGTKERLFVCSYCGKAFNRPKKVEIHQRIHTGEKPFSCSTCGKMFSEAGNLRKHHRVHTGEKPYGCGACGKGFAWIRNLKAHQRKTHPDIYPEGDQICT